MHEHGTGSVGADIFISAGRLRLMSGPIRASIPSLIEFVQKYAQEREVLIQDPRQGYKQNRERGCAWAP